jgi:hypothetical protein
MGSIASSRSRGRRVLRHLSALAVAGSLSLLAIGAVAADHESGHTELYVAMSGANQVGHGHPRAVGEAHIGVDAGGHRVCANIRVRGTGPVTAAHIHRGAAGEVGETVVTLSADGFNDSFSGCTPSIEEEVLSTMPADPAGYYLNIYTADFPDGAIRGQLEVYAPVVSPVLAPITSRVDLQAWLSGAKAVPPGDPDGSGAVNMAITYGEGRICFNISVDDIEPATSASLHRGAPGEVGEVAVILDSLGFVVWSDGCLDDVDVTLMDAIAADPGSYYVNVMTADFPDGAIRGQLEAFWPSHLPSPSGEPDGIGSAGNPRVLPDAAVDDRTSGQVIVTYAGWLLVFTLSLVAYAIGVRHSLHEMGR